MWHPDTRYDVQDLFSLLSVPALTEEDSLVVGKGGQKMCRADGFFSPPLGRPKKYASQAEAKEALRSQKREWARRKRAESLRDVGHRAANGHEVDCASQLG